MSVRVKSVTWLLVAIVLAVGSGCARPDWIEQTLVTVDVTGVWRGTFEGGGGSGTMELTLQQSGAKVNGHTKLSPLSMYSGPVEGTVSGDTFRFRSQRGGTVIGELQVNGDEMTGPGTTWFGSGTMTLRRQQ